MQNEPKFRKSQMNVNKVLTRDYENIAINIEDPAFRGRNTKPIQTQTNPITEKQKMNVNKVLTKGYENKSHFWVKAKQTQYKAKTNPICRELACPVCLVSQSQEYHNTLPCERTSIHLISKE